MFEINSNTAVSVSGFSCTAVDLAIRRFLRDISFTIEPSDRNGTVVSIARDGTLEPEAWTMDAADASLSIHAADELGVVYALIHLSSEALGVQPLWYWCDQEFDKVDCRFLIEDHARSVRRPVRFRGWFINDEVLFMGWKPDGKGEEQWLMAFEALLRLGGNIIIPGTDRNAVRYQRLASSMGLWITHHHSQPLGAEMFSRAYPGIRPSYDEHPELFEKLWRDGVDDAQGMKVLWTIGFRGQGDTAFWGNDPGYDTEEKRAGLINRVIRRQIEIVSERFDDPIFAFNIYNETAGFYRNGLLDIPDDVIRLFADNGYGCMVSRREWDDDPRIPSLPKEEDKDGANGMYYHVSFYDLQAANHITMIPVPLPFLASQLNTAYEGGIREAIILNVSNIKPHLVPISLVADFWNNGRCDETVTLDRFCHSYHGGHEALASKLYHEYSDASVRYGSHVDNRAGDQYLAYPVRMFLTSWIRSSFDGCHEYDFAFYGSLDEQVRHYREEMTACHEMYSALLKKIEAADIPLLDEGLGVHARWYAAASEGASAFTASYEAFRKGDLVSAFIASGKAVDGYIKAVTALRSWEHGKWVGFYSNEALTDTGNMVNLMKDLMEYIRIWGEGPYFYQWHRLFTYTEEDRDVVLVTNYEKRMSAYDMYRSYMSIMGSDAAFGE